jgi:hypothetical protein
MAEVDTAFGVRGHTEPDEEGWIVAIVLAVGRTRDEARENVIDAPRLMLAPDDGDPNVSAGRSEPLDLILTSRQTERAGWPRERNTRRRNADGTRATAVPRHTEIGPGLIRAICRQLDIPAP